MTNDLKLEPVELLICTTCKMGLPIEDDNMRPGNLLHKAMLEQDLPEHVTVRAVECFTNCQGGCNIMMRGGNRYAYVYGNLDPDTQVETIVDGVTRYYNAADGFVPWRERPVHFRKNCVARIPPLNLPQDAAK
jgi:predicted metal-binding protein